MNEKQRYEYLKNRVAELDGAYYKEDRSIVPDLEYDRLKKELEELESAHPEWLDESSPSARPGGKAVKGKKIQHQVKLLSLQDYFSEDDIAGWHQKTGSLPCTVEQKIDGLTLALTYVNNKFVMGATRGDGSVGEDVTANVPFVRDIPLELPILENVDPDNNKLLVRVEVYQPVDAFLELNKQQEARGLEPYSNPRNCASGGLRADDPEITRARGLRAFAFRILYAEGWDAVHVREKQSMDLEVLSALGFAAVPYYTAVYPGDILRAIHDIADDRPGLPYWIDGAVVKIDDIEKQNQLGEGSKYPAWAAAYKYPAERKTVTIKSIRLQTGRTGAITPIAEFDPVQIGGTMVSNATLHNQKFITDNQIGIGCVAELIKSGEIIPKIDKIITPAGNIFHINRCPSCGAIAVERLDQDGSPTGVMMCSNDFGCPAQLQRYFEFFCAKDVMDIAGMGPSAIEVLIGAGLLEHIWDIYDLPDKIGRIAALPGFGTKKAEKLAAEIEKSKHNDIDRLIKALGIPGVGRHTGRLLAKTYPGMAAIRNLDITTLLALEGIGEITARDIVSAWANGKSELLDKLAAKGVNMTSKTFVQAETDSKLADDKPLAGMTIVATGTIEGFGRADIEDFITKNGGKAAGSVSKKTTCVIAGANAGSKLRKAQDLGIPVYSIDEFRAKYQV